MALSNADRQRQWRQRHKGWTKADQALADLEEARMSAQTTGGTLKARIAELEAKVAELAPQAERWQASIRGDAGQPIRLYDDYAEDDDDADWTDDDEDANHLFQRMTFTRRGERHPYMGDIRKMADLIERAGPQFVDAARRYMASTEAKAAAADQAKLTPRTSA
jgi:hypothetical protein